MNEMYNGRIFDLFTPEKVNSLLEKGKMRISLIPTSFLTWRTKRDYILR